MQFRTFGQACPDPPRPFVADRPTTVEPPEIPLLLSLRPGLRWTTRFIVIVVVGLLGVSLAACGSRAAGGGAGGGPTGEADPTATLRFAYIPPASIDPHRTTCACETVQLGPVYEALVGRTPEGEPVPGLAESWEFVDNGAALVFHLRQGVTFHDGTPFDAAAVKANIERGLTLPESTVKGDLAAIASVDVVDANTARLNLKGPAASLPLTLSHIAGYMISPAAMNGDLNSTMVGTGPYTLAEYRPGTRMVYKRFDGYWDREHAAKAATIDIMLTSDTTATFNALRSGQIDIAGILPNEAGQAGTFGLNVQPIGGLGFYHLQMNRSLAPFDNELVRQAMNFAIDRESIFKALQFGFGGPTTEPFPPNYFAYSGAAAADYSYDPAKARELLTRAGHNGDLTFDVLVPAGGASVPVAEAVKSQLQDVGVTMNIQTIEGSQFAPTFYGAGSTIPAGLLQWTGRPDPRQTFSQLYSATGYGNPGRHTTPEVEQLLAAANAPQEDPAAEQAAVQAATAQVMAQALDVPIYYYTQPLAFSDKVVGVQPWITGYVNLRELGVTR